VDLLATKKFASLARGSITIRRARHSLPAADDVFGARNLNAGDNPDNYNSGIGYVQPNIIYNTGADITLTPALVASARFGYFHTDYQDRGTPSGIRYYYRDPRTLRHWHSSGTCKSAQYQQYTDLRGGGSEHGPVHGL